MTGGGLGGSLVSHHLVCHHLVDDSLRERVDTVYLPYRLVVGDMVDVFGIGYKVVGTLPGKYFLTAVVEPVKSDLLGRRMPDPWAPAYHHRDTWPAGLRSKAIYRGVAQYFTTTNDGGKTGYRRDDGKHFSYIDMCKKFDNSEWWVQWPESEPYPDKPLEVPK